MFKFIDLFAGMGGIRLGLEQALDKYNIEHKCVMTSEIKPHALKVYKDNFGDENIVGDITKIEGCDIPDFDMLLAGFPCFVGDTKIYTDKGFKNISSIDIGDVVLTHKNTFERVLEKSYKISNDVYRLRLTRFRKILVTGNHPFYVRKKDGDLFTEAEWVNVKDLKKGMYIGVPSEIVRREDVHILRENSGFQYSNGIYWVKLRKKAKKVFGKYEVFNITVENENTYTANGFIVHNCQPFSSAGKRLGFEDTRGTMFFEVARILKEKKPKYFLLENVENLIRHDLSLEDKKNGKTIGKTLETILNVLKDMGYFVTWKVIQASDYGVPQIRKRIYIVGSLDKEISLEDFEKKDCCFNDIKEKGIVKNSDFNIKLMDYLKKNNLDTSYLYGKGIRDKRGSKNNLRSWNLGLRGEVNKAQEDLLEKLSKERKRKDLADKKGVPLKDGVSLTKEELNGIYNGENIDEDIEDLVKKGYLKKIDRDGVVEYDINGGRLSYEFTKFIDPYEPCMTLVATEARTLGVVEDNGVRKLTLRECLSLNGYPKDYKVEDISESKYLDLLGNTVVVPIIKMICERIVDNEG